MIELTDKQLLVIKGKVCPYCGKATEFVDSSVIYKKSYGMIYYCKPCDAYVGVHKETNNALGRVANKELRKWKKEAHKYLDLLWQEKHETRKNIYGYLSIYLDLPEEYTHIGMFSIKTCKDVIDWAKMIRKDLIREMKDLGFYEKAEKLENKKI